MAVIRYKEKLHGSILAFHLNYPNLETCFKANNVNQLDRFRLTKKNMWMILLQSDSKRHSLSVFLSAAGLRMSIHLTPF